MEPFLFFESMNYINAVCYIPVIFFILQIIDYLGNSSTSTGISQFIYNLFSGFFMVVISVSVLSSQGNLKKSRLAESQMIRQEVHDKEHETRIEESRKMRHDIKYIISAIQRFIDLDDKEGLLEFSQQLARKNDVESNMIPYTGNLAVDGVIYSYINCCALNNIEFKYSGTVPASAIDSMDICILIGNALENAYTACLRLESGKGKIRLLCKRETNFLSIVVQNTFDGQLKFSDDKTMLSMKRDNEIGIGLLSMKSICDRYGGVMEYNWTDDTFNIMFMIPVN